MDAPALPIPPDNRILFFSRDREQFGFLSHFHPAPVEVDGETWPTVEHYYQAQRSESQAYRRAIRNAATPGQAKKLAASPHSSKKTAQHSWFRLHQQEVRADWGEVKLDIMRRADRAKYTQNPDLRALLLATGDAEIVEDTNGDGFWGIGPDGSGPNWAGRVLMEMRAELAGPLLDRA